MEWNKMLISAVTPSNDNRCVKSYTAQLKQRMATAGPKRRRVVSNTSTSSTSTQMTNLSEDSQQQPISPTHFVQSSDGKRPVFRLDSQDDEDSYNTVNAVFTAGSITNNHQHSSTFNCMPFSPGINANKPSSMADFEARRLHVKATKRARPNRRQSESVIIEHREPSTFLHGSHTTTCMAHNSMQDDADETCRKHVFNPNRTSGSRLSIDNISSIECQCNEGFHRRPLVSKERAKSVDALENIRVLHVYEPLNSKPRQDTEVYMAQGNIKPVVQISRKRLSSSLSETPPETIKDRDDAESGYIRSEKIKPGVCESLSICVKQHTLTILIVINILVVSVNFVLFPYILIGKSKDGSGEKGSPNCFQCSDLPAHVLRASIDNGHTEKFGDSCCFKTDGDWTSWVVQQVSMQSSRPFAYLQGKLTNKSMKENRIEWEDNQTTHMKLTDHKTAVAVEEKGFYFLFSRVHYRGNDVSSPVTISHSISKLKVSENWPKSLGTVSQKCRLEMNSSNIEHISVLDTIAFLDEGDVVYVDVHIETYINHNKKHAFGLFKIS